MKSKKLIKIAILALAAVGMQSCDSFFDNEPDNI